MKILNEIEINKQNKLGKYAEKGIKRDDISKFRKGKIFVDHSNTKCCICNSKETRIRNEKYEWFRYKTDENGNFETSGINWDRKSYVCQLCYRKQYYHEKEKLKAKWRNKQLSRNSESGKGFIGEQIWCKTRGVKNCNIENDNFHSKQDHSRDSEYGVVNSKISTLNTKINSWQFGTEGKCDNIICFCMDKEWKNVERTYIIPKSETINRSHIIIFKNSPKSWYEKYRIDETPYNEAYHSLSLKECFVLKSEE